MRRSHLPLGEHNKGKSGFACRCCASLTGLHPFQWDFVKEKPGEAERVLRLLQCDKGQGWDILSTDLGSDFTQIEGSIRFTHLTGPSLNALNKLQNLDLKSPREGELNSALLKMVGDSDLLEKSILRRYYSNSGIKDCLSC